MTNVDLFWWILHKNSTKSQVSQIQTSKATKYFILLLKVVVKAFLYVTSVYSLRYHGNRFKLQITACVMHKKYMYLISLECSMLKPDFTDTPYVRPSYKKLFKKLSRGALNEVISNVVTKWLDQTPCSSLSNVIHMVSADS